MSQNIISLTTLLADLPEIDAALATLEAKFSDFASLDGEERQALNKMGNKSEVFCRQVITLLGQHPSVVPPSLDVAEAQRDLANLDGLRPRLMRLNKLLRLAEDTEMALGSDVMCASTDGYRFLNLAGQGQGLEELLKEVSVRWQKKRSKTPEPSAG